MSRIGRMPVTLPAGVTVKIEQNTVTVKGPKGELTRRFQPSMKISQKESSLVVERASENQVDRALHGLTRSLLANMVKGVTDGFQRDLEIVGVGYRAEKSGNKLNLRVGQTHPMEVEPQPGITFTVEGVNKIHVMGIDKEVVGQTAAEIRGLRPPDAYKGKGIRYAGEVIHLKPGKAGKVVGRK